MAADQTTIAKQVTYILNAGTLGSYTATIDTNYKDRHADAITESIRQAALKIGSAILANPAHIHRNAFISGTPTTLTHGGELPDMAGEGDLIEIEPYSGGTWITGTPKTVQQIESYRANPSNLYSATAHTVQNSPISGYYAIKNGRVYFTGNAARGYFPVLSRTGVLTIIPDEYEDVWTALAVGLSVKEGDNLFPIGQYYMDYGMRSLAMIPNMGVIQKLPTFQRNERGDNI